MSDAGPNAGASGGTGAEELWRLVKSERPDALSSAALDRDLTEGMAVMIARSRSAPAEALGFLATDRRFAESYKLKLAICRNPRSPLRVALSLVKHLRIFDAADLTRDQRLPLVLRQKVEHQIAERICSLPSGVKIALSRRACGSIVTRLMEKSERRVVDACLQSPTLTEEGLCRLILRQSTRADVIRAVSEHPKWSLRYGIRFALIRNFFTPMPRAVEFLGGLKSGDLRFLYADPKLPTATRPFIYMELEKRCEPLDEAEEEEYVLSEDDDEGLEAGPFGG